VLHNLWSISIAVTKLHLCTNSRLKCYFPEPLSKILSSSFKLIFVIILSTLRFEVIMFLLSFIFFLFIITLFNAVIMNFAYQRLIITTYFLLIITLFNAFTINFTFQRLIIITYFLLFFSCTVSITSDYDMLTN